MQAKWAFTDLVYLSFLMNGDFRSFYEKNHKLQTDYSLSTQEEQNLIDTAQDEGVELTLWSKQKISLQQTKTLMSLDFCKTIY